MGGRETGRGERGKGEGEGRTEKGGGRREERHPDLKLNKEGGQALENPQCQAPDISVLALSRGQGTAPRSMGL